MFWSRLSENTIEVQQLQRRTREAQEDATRLRSEVNSQDDENRSGKLDTFYPHFLARLLFVLQLSFCSRYLHCWNHFMPNFYVCSSFVLQKMLFLYLFMNFFLMISTKMLFFKSKQELKNRKQQFETWGWQTAAGPKDGPGHRDRQQPGSKAFQTLIQDMNILLYWSYYVDREKNDFI